MHKEITIACPKCDSHFIVPREYIGGIVDCSECGTAFEVIALPEEAGSNTKSKDTRQVREKNAQNSTNTIVMSRNDLGMIPDLEDVQIR